MKKHKLRNLGDDEMRNQLREMDDQLFRLKFQTADGPDRRSEEDPRHQEGSRAHHDWLKERELAGAAK